jgi:alpha-D-ribose 1-methylphosphonate 5-triphosphate synthase subunit PhnG
MEELKKLQKIIHYINDEEINKIINYIKQKDSHFHKEEIGMIMSQVNDSFGNPFFLGEILVSEAEVEFKNTRGYGMVMGSNKNLALILATVDSALQIEDKLFIEELNRFLEPARIRAMESINTEKTFVSGTKVNFGLMVEG